MNTSGQSQRRFGHYDVKQVLRSSVARSTLLAQKQPDGSEVVLKIYRRPSSQSADTFAAPHRRFERRISKLIEIQHPSIARLHLVGRQGTES